MGGYLKELEMYMQLQHEQNPHISLEWAINHKFPLMGGCDIKFEDKQMLIQPRKEHPYTAEEIKSYLTELQTTGLPPSNPINPTK